MKRFSLVLMMIGMATSMYAQSGLLWSSDFSAEMNNYYSETPIIRMIGDTIEVVGKKNTLNGQRLSIVKYDLQGDTISTKIYGGDSVSNSLIVDYKFDASNNVYILQQEQLGFYKTKIVIQKYGLDGNLIWVEQIQNEADTSYTPRFLGLANDSSVFVTAHKEYDYPQPGDDVLFIKTIAQLYAFNSNGNQLWLREFNQQTEISWFDNDIFFHDNDIFLFGQSRLVKLDMNNNIILNVSTDLLHGVSDVQLTPDNNLLITAYVRYRISKIDLNGVLIWTQLYETNLPNNIGGDEVRATIQDSAGHIYITGRHYGSNFGNSSYTNADILTLKYDSDGNLIWQNRYEHGINNADIGNTILLKNGQIYVGGSSQRLGVGTDYDYVVLKIDSTTGLSTGGYRYDGMNGNDAVSSLYVFDNGNVALTGLSYKNTQYDWTTQLLADVVLSTEIFSLENEIQVYPNPISNGEALTIIGNGIQAYSIISEVGQVVQRGALELNETQTLHLDKLASGMYMLYLETDQGIKIRKLIVN